MPERGAVVECADTARVSPPSRVEPHMTVPHEDHTPARLLEIRTVEIIAGKGRSVTLSSVRCPVRHGSAAVEECADCSESEGVAKDVLARGEWLCCRTRSSAEPVRGVGPPVRELMGRTSIAFRSALAASSAASALHARRQPGAKVADAMSRVALSIQEDAPASRAAALLAEHGAERVAVVSGDGAVVGVL